MARRSKPKARAWGSAFERPEREGWYIRFSWSGRRITRYGAQSERAARKKLRDIRAMLENGSPLDDVLTTIFGDFDGDSMTFRQAVEPYTSYAKHRKRPSTLIADKSRFDCLAPAPWTAKRLGEVTTEDLARWADRRSAEGMSGATINRYMAAVSALYKWAIQLGYVRENPVRRFASLPEPAVMETYLTPTEVEILLEACSTSLRPLATVAVHTGMRRGELLGLRWRAVNLEDRTIRVGAKTAKSGRARSVPMSRTVADVLGALREALPALPLDGGTAVFLRPDGTPYSGDALKYQFAAAVARAAKAPAGQRDWKLPASKVEALRFHDLRHSAASLMVAASVPIFDVGKILGHANVQTTLRYAHFAPKAGRAAADALDSMLQGASRRRGSRDASAR